jgi:hypothetical protein
MIRSLRWAISVALSFLLVLIINNSIPFVTLPGLGSVIVKMGYAASFANGSFFDFYAYDFGYPKPAAISFGLAGSWPAGILIRLGLHPADAYTGIAAIYLALAMVSAYLIARRFEVNRLTSLLGAVAWMSMPITWNHVGYSTLSWGIALLPFYFFAPISMFNAEAYSSKRIFSFVTLYFVATCVSVFMDGYTFMMFASGSSILLIYSAVTRHEIRSALIKTWLPTHLLSFALAYFLYSTYIGKSNYDPHSIDFFRGWGLDLSFLVMPSKNVHWLPDFLGLSVKRTNDYYFGDGSVWQTTFALPLLMLGLYSWWITRHVSKNSKSIVLITIFGFYMALGPSLKVNSTKPEALQLSHPRGQSALMVSEYAIAPTGNAWISEKLPGFNVMRASYRWSALGVFGLWLLVMMAGSNTDPKRQRFWLLGLVVVVLFNLPDIQKKLSRGADNRNMVFQIDSDLVSDLSRNIKPGEKVAFVPWGNDLIVNYLVPKLNVKSYNIGGDKNLLAAQPSWPSSMLASTGEIDSRHASHMVKMLIEGSADVVVIPYFHMLYSALLWQCPDRTAARLTAEELERLRLIPNFICPEKRKNDLAPIVAELRALPHLDVVETDLFATVRLRPEFADQANRLALLGSILNNVQYPVSISPEFAEALYLLQDGWHGLEAHHVWSMPEARLLLPVPKQCQTEKCELRLIFGVFGASGERPVDILFNSAEPGWDWSAKVTAVSGEPISLNVPLAGAAELRNFGISVPDAKSPLELNGSPDGRILGISLQRIELVKP